MKNAILKNGLIAAGILIGINLVAFVVLGTDPANYDVGEVIGYTTIVACLAFVVLGMREVELQSNDLTFFKRIGVGAAISAFPSLAFGIYNVIYVKWLDPTFIETYNQHTLDKMKATMSAEEFAQAQAQYAADMELWNNLSFQFVIMFLTVFLIGLVITLLSAMYFQYVSSKNQKSVSLKTAAK